MARPDPRAEPTTLPPTEAASIEHVALSPITAEPAVREPMPDLVFGEETAPAPSAPRSVTSADPRVAALEPLVTINDWRSVAQTLGALEDAGKLPPNLGLVAAVAHNEAAKEGSDEARELAIRCTAALLGMPPESHTVRVLARRLLRKNPVRFAERKAPTARVSLMIVLAVLALGAGAGWFLSTATGARLLSLVVK